MNKLIDYNGLSTFQTNLLNDSSVSSKATWSSEKINTSKQNKLTAGNNISISTDTISADGYVFDETEGSFATTYMDYWHGSDLVANVAKGVGAFAEGAVTSASSNYAHAEGYNTTASHEGAHAEGSVTVASGTDSHAEGCHTVASGYGSHSEGWYTISQNESEHAEGKHNKSHKANDTFGNAGNTLYSTGIGSVNTRKNAVEVMQNGDHYILGIGNYDGIHIKGEQGAPANTKTLQEVIAALEARIAALENPNA